MNAKELRLGNIVFDENGKYWQIMTGREIDDDIFNPVPLTPEILEKCGFASESIHIGAVITGETVSINRKAVVETYIKKIGIRPQYLHQLQNLYFALTGEELQITL